MLVSFSPSFSFRYYFYWRGKVINVFIATRSLFPCFVLIGVCEFCRCSRRHLGMTSPLFIAHWFVTFVPSSFMAVSDSDVRSSWGFRLLYSLHFSFSLLPRLSVFRSLLPVFRCLLFFLPVSSVISTFSFSFVFLVSFPSLTGSPISLPLRSLFRSSFFLVSFRYCFFFFSFFVLSFLLATPISFFIYFLVFSHFLR